VVDNAACMRVWVVLVPPLHTSTGGVRLRFTGMWQDCPGDRRAAILHQMTTHDPRLSPATLLRAAP
jgi:hypothetical protein